MRPKLGRELCHHPTRSWYETHMPTDPAVQPEMAYAVHTHTCTYLLDDAGVCRWIVAARGAVPSHIQRCIGAQFVACLDLAHEGGLIGELCAGARALFVGRGADHMLLLRTGEILSVDDRRDPQGVLHHSPARPGAPFDGAEPRGSEAAARQYGQRAGLPYQAQPPPRFGVVRREGEEQTITIPTRGHGAGSGFGFF